MLWGEALSLLHHGTALTVAEGAPQTLPIPPRAEPPEVHPPAGREPLRDAFRTARTREIQD
jgi:hypothetical protein